MKRWKARGSWVLRWGGVVAAVVMAAALAAGCWWSVTWCARDYSAIITVERGAAIVQRNLGRKGMLVVPGTVRLKTGWSIRRDPGLSRRAWRPRVEDWRGGALRTLSVSLPLWIPLVLVLIPAGLAWRRRSRRARVGVCVACGYDLAGLAAAGGTAVCPECGRRDEEKAQSSKHKAQTGIEDR